MDDPVIHKRPIEKWFDQHGYRNVGRCIYCTSHKGSLTKEHIIAKALNGTITLAGSSCQQCQRITRALEDFCFNEMMRPFRLKVGFRTSHPKHMPVAVPAREGEDPQTILYL